MQYFRFAKSEIQALEHDKAAAAQARERYEFRQSRIERDKQERAEKLAQKERDIRAARQAAATSVESQVEASAAQDSSAQARIQAAIERAREQAAAVQPKNIDALTPQQQADVDEIETRRAKAHELAHPDNEQAKD